VERTVSAASERESGQRKRRESDRTAGRSDGGRGGAAALHRAAGNQAVKAARESGEVQAKLAVGRPESPAEREADRVAETVLTASEGRAVDGVRWGSGESGGRVVEGAAADRIESLRGGKPLARSTRSFFEERFGRDFADVRVHTGPAADRAARSIGAEAFTLGTDIAFANGNYDPRSRAGTRLLAHELTHVVQQTGRSARMVRRQSDGEPTFEELRNRLTDPAEWANFWDWNRDRRERELRAVRAVSNAITDRDDIEDWRAATVRRRRLAHIPSPEGMQEGVGGYMPYESNVAWFRVFFQHRIPDELDVEPDDLLTTSSDVEAANENRETPYRELPPFDLWAELVPTLEVLAEWKRAFPTITFDVDSVFRSEHVNTLSGGASESQHRGFSAIDFEPRAPDEVREKFHAYLRVYYELFGARENLGLNIYSSGRIHVDTGRGADAPETWGHGDDEPELRGGDVAEDWREAQETLDRPLERLLYPEPRRPLGPAGPGGEVQPKLRVSRPTDPAEREAERVAEAVTSVRASEPAVTDRGGVGSAGSATLDTAPDGLSERIESLDGTGERLPEATRSFFEARFGRDFSDVRVHAGADADALARSIEARAFTHGTDVVFRSDRYDPGSRRGRRLIAHELTHVVQQSGDRAVVARQDAGVTGTDAGTGPADAGGPAADPPADASLPPPPSRTAYYSARDKPVEDREYDPERYEEWMDRLRPRPPRSVSQELWSVKPKSEPHSLGSVDDPRAYVKGWLEYHESEVAAAERKYEIDRRAIAGVIAWEALHNVYPSTVFGIARWRGPGKVHFKSGYLTEGDPVAETVEVEGYLPWGEQTKRERAKRLESVSDSITYIAVIMRFFTDIGEEEDIQLACEPALLATAYQSWSAEYARTVSEKYDSSSGMDHNEFMGEWVANNLGYLTEVVGESTITCGSPSGAGGGPTGPTPIR